MIAKWQVKGDTLGGYKCVTLQGTNEKCLSGMLGEIWDRGNGLFGALQAKYGKFEKLFSFEIKDLKKWRLALKIPLDPALQLQWANNPNTRLTRLK